MKTEKSPEQTEVNLAQARVTVVKVIMLQSQLLLALSCVALQKGQLTYLINSLSTNPIKCSNTLKQFVGNRRRIMSAFDHFVGLGLKGLNGGSKLYGKLDFLALRTAKTANPQDNRKHYNISNIK